VTAPGDVTVWQSTGTRSDTDAALRAALAEGLGLLPKQVPLERDRDGRPIVRGTALEVSVSHSVGVILVAVASGLRVGIDVEVVRTGPWRLLPTHALTPRELRELDACSPGSWSAALLRYWTRKEALLKAAGVGLAVDPRSVEVSGPDEPARVLSLPSTLGAPESWSLVDLEIDGCAATLAVAGPAPCVILRRASSGVGVPSPGPGQPVGTPPSERRSLRPWNASA
jgi:4'-phosphopantetheinyl transferase